MLIAGAVIAGAVLSTGALSGGRRSAGGTPRAGLVVGVGGIPAGLAVDEAAGTVYVAAGRAGLVMLKTTACGPFTTRGCHALPAPGSGPPASDVAVDGPSHTVYVANGPAGTVTVLNAATCNAITSRGCSSPVAVIRLHGLAQALALDATSGVLYADMLVPPRHQPVTIGSLERQVAVISTRACDASATGGCGQVATVPLGHGLHAAIAVDQATGTVYAAEASELAVIDGRACAARSAGGCAKLLATVPAYGYVTGIAAGAGLVYLTSPGTGTVTMLRAAACGAASTAGCGRAVFVRAGAGPFAALADPPAHTLYVTDAATNAVSMLDPAACDRVVSGGCSPSVPAFPVGAAPGSAAVDLATHTLYVGNLNARTVSVISAATCDATVRRGCPARPAARTPAIRQTSHTCDPDVAAYESGQLAGPFMRDAVRVAGGTTDRQPWSLWARKGVFDPNGIEQGGLVLGGRWYALCSEPLSAGADPVGMELIDSSGRGTVYGYVQYPKHLTVVLTASGPLPRPASIPLHGTTFFIETLPRPACGYHTLTLHGRAPGWAAVTNIILGACEPELLSDIISNDGTWGPRR